ncbi:MFS transporter [Paraneptunicella aestuarii]|uniref:MFS transporter n=1 Tax=Paraneptunicella aestuarii TaxID=2831148 RepID=UPI001E42526B|nr:MFS transporter [Paraneptunicella aestuarii]UAA39174.1 MFS transporter [Paraneptunicella aestuarii]
MMRILPVLILAMSGFLVSVAMSISVIFIPVKLESMFQDEHIIGALLSLEPFLVVVFCFFLPAMLRFQGTLYWLALMLPIKGIAFNLMQYSSVWTWGGAIILLGIAGGGQITLYQYWCSQYCSQMFSGNQGMVLGIFATAISLGLAVGPYFQAELLSMATYFPLLQQWQLNNASGLILLFGVLGTLPVMMIYRSAPHRQTIESYSFVDCYRRTKGAMLAIVTTGCCFFSCTGFLVLYGLDNQLDDAPYLFSAFILGALMLELPIAAISDRVDRKYMIVLCIMVSMSCVSFLPIAITHFYYAVTLLFIWGGFMGAIYSVALALISELCEQDGLLVSSCTYTLMENIGGIIGLILTGLFTTLIGGDALVYVLMAACLAYFAYALTRYPIR